MINENRVKNKSPVTKLRAVCSNFLFREFYKYFFIFHFKNCTMSSAGEWWFDSSLIISDSLLYWNTLTLDKKSASIIFPIVQILKPD